ncbi:MAG: hypothetical protein ACK5LE_02200 [Alphaproteobacteria bacterium]
MPYKYLRYSLIALLLGAFYSSAEGPTEQEIRTAVTEKTNNIRRLMGFEKLHENDDWVIYSYLAILSQDGQGPKDIYVYVPKDGDLEGLKLRVHGYQPFPFPTVSYSQFQRFLNDPSALDELTFHLSDENTADFKRRFINSLRLDFATDYGYQQFFRGEEANFESFKDEYLPKLSQIREWNDLRLKMLRGNWTRPIPDALLADKEFSAFLNKIALLGIDFVIPGVTDSSCSRCFMMVSGYTPADNYSGFLWIEDESQLPEWSPNGIFFRQSLGNGWYIFRST